MSFTVKAQSGKKVTLDFSAFMHLPANAVLSAVCNKDGVATFDVRDLDGNPVSESIMIYVGMKLVPDDAGRIQYRDGGVVVVSTATNITEAFIDPDDDYMVRVLVEGREGKPSQPLRYAIVTLKYDIGGSDYFATSKTDKDGIAFFDKTKFTVDHDTEIEIHVNGISVHSFETLYTNDGCIQTIYVKCDKRKENWAVLSVE